MPSKFVKRPDGQVSSIPHDVVVTVPYCPSSVDCYLFRADAPYKVVAVRVETAIAGTDAGAVTVDVKKCSSTQAPSAGTSVLTGTVSLKSTAGTSAAGTLTSTQSTLVLAAGERLGLDFTGTMTAAGGTVQVNLKRLQSVSGDK